MIPFDKQILDGKFNMGNITVDGISSKNKLKILPINTTINGVSFISNEDGSITLNGTANANCSLVISSQKISEEGDYIFGVTSDFSDIGHNFEVGGYIYNADGSYKENISTATEYRHISNGEYISNFFIYFSSGATFNNFKIYPQLEKGKKRTNYSKYFDVYSNTQIITTGVEFKTGRIIDGNEEYGKRIYFGTLPNNSSKSVAHNITNANKITGYQTFAYYKDGRFGGLTIPRAVGNDYIELQLTETDIFIASNIDASYFNAEIEIYYTKN